MLTEAGGVDPDVHCEAWRHRLATSLRAPSIVLTDQPEDTSAVSGPAVAPAVTLPSPPTHVLLRSGDPCT